MRRLTLLLFIGLFHINLYAEALSIENISAHIQKGLQTRIKGQNKPIIQNIYAQTGNKPLWIGSQNKTKTSHLIQALNDPLFNYKNKSFDQTSIKLLFFQLDNGEISQSRQAAAYAKLDLVLTSSMVRLVRFIVQGDVDWNMVQEKMMTLEQSDDIVARWEMSPKAFPDQKELISAIEDGDIYEYLTSLLPMEKRYRKLVKVLKDYRIMDKFPQIKYSDKVLKIGDSDGRVKEIKKRLQISGDYPKECAYRL